MAHYFGLAQGYMGIIQRSMEHLQFLHDRKPAANEQWAKQRIQQIDVMISGPMAIGLYAVLIAAALYFWLRTKLNLRDTNIVE